MSILNENQLENSLKKTFHGRALFKPSVIDLHQLQRRQLFLTQHQFASFRRQRDEFFHIYRQWQNQHGLVLRNFILKILWIFIWEYFSSSWATSGFLAIKPDSGLAGLKTPLTKDITEIPHRMRGVPFIKKTSGFYRKSDIILEVRTQNFNFLKISGR